MQQEKALSFLKAGYSVFLTGSAGTGKTYVLNKFIQYLKERKVPVGVTASTGIAATHLNGMTIHSWSGIGIKDDISMSDLSRMKEKKYLRTHLEAAKVLIIDEISMLHGRQLNMVDRVLRYFKQNPDPFGGIQVVFCGDFFQLPPIGMREEENRDKFAFMSSSWNELKPVICYLTEQFRQSDNQLNQILGNIRSGEIDYDLMEVLQSTYYHESSDDATRLYTHNADVDRINKEHLEQLPGSKRMYKAKTKGNARLVETLKKAVLAEEELELKVGSKVMFVRNNPEMGVVNGTLGTVSEFDDEGHPVVELVSGKMVTAKADSWSVDDDSGKPLAVFTQVPLRLAWAITVHKSQGMTLDEAEIDLSKVFERGQGYVALSRLKELKSLRLLGFNQRALEVDPLALKADKRLMQLSAQVDQQVTTHELETRFETFLKQCGGLVSKEEIAREKLKTSAKAKGKNTYEQTHDMIKEGLSIAEIAEKRGLSAGTVLSHLAKVKEMFPKVNLEAYRPPQGEIDAVAEAIEEIRDNEHAKTSSGEFKLSAIKKLCNHLDFDQIKLALLYIK